MEPRGKFAVTALILFIQRLHLVDSALKCEFRYGVNTRFMGISDRAAQSIKYHTGHSSFNMQAFECFCTNTYDKISDADVNTITQVYNIGRDWRQSEVFSIRNCNELEIGFDASPNGIASNLGDGAIFIFEDIGKLYMNPFRVTTGGIPRAAGVYFKNVTLNDPNQIIMDVSNIAESIFYKIRVPRASLRITAVNTDNRFDSSISVEESTFGNGQINYFNLDGDLNNFDFKLEVRNEQLGTSCGFDYRGWVWFLRNNLKRLGREDIVIDGSAGVEVIGNKIGLAGQNCLTIRNPENLILKDNRFDLYLRDPLATLAYSPFGTRVGSCSDPSLPPSRIGNFEVSGNVVPRLNPDTFYLDVDRKYESNFVSSKFRISNTVVMQTCNCSVESLRPGSIPTTSFTGNSAANSYANDLSVFTLESQMCYPPGSTDVFGRRSDICSGSFPESVPAALKRTTYEVAYQWMVYLIIAVVVTFVLTTFIMFVIVKYACRSSESKSRSVSPT